MESKPLGRKSYGSIPHLIGSRIGEGDHHIDQGRAEICTVKARKGDMVYVTEKVDGSCTAVANVDGNILSLGRAGYLARTSKYEQHHMFADWVENNISIFKEIIQPGQRIVGEWLAQAHGTRYKINKAYPWAPFDLMVGKDRFPYDELIEVVGQTFKLPHLIHFGGAISIENALLQLGTKGQHGAIDDQEGAVWRVESNGKFNFLAKYVKPEKQDGIYLPEISGKDAVWNWKPEGVE